MRPEARYALFSILCKAIDKFDKNVTEVSDTLFCKPGREGHRWAGGDDGGDHAA